MRFRTKLTLFLIATLLAIQASTGFATYSLIRRILIEDRVQRLIVAADQFTRQLHEMERQMAAGIRVLTLDFALRQAIAEHDHATVVSTLRNHGARVGASRMMLVEMDGTISADTARLTGRFPYPDLLEPAIVQGSVAIVAVMAERPVWLVVVPVLAPVPIAYVVASLPLDDELLLRLRSLAGLPPSTGLAIGGPDGWRVAAGPIDADLVAQLPPGVGLSSVPRLIRQPAGETIFLARSLQSAPGGPLVAAVMAFPLSEALHPYRGLILVVVLGLSVGLVAAVAGAWLISRGVARPLELLARHTSRIAAGDYVAPPAANRRDEIGLLSTALGNMTRAIAEREEHIRHQATHDPITELPNRSSLSQTIDAIVGRAPAAVIGVELPHLQEIANTVGRDLAERIMCDAAQRLATLSSDAPLGCVGERSFALLSANSGAESALAMAGRIIELFDQPYREGDLTIDTTAAVGIALAPEHGRASALLLRRAEVALQAAQRSDQRVSLYHAETDPHRPELLSLMSELRRGLQQGDLQLFYQPKLALATGQIAGSEALVRWTHPTRGVIPPDAFIPLAEETGNIQHLTRWALRTGIAQAAEWHRTGSVSRISINLSVRDLADVELPRRVAALLSEHDLPADALVLEVTESAIMGEPDAAIAVLRRLVEQGIALAIDDFGVGQSSLAYLRRLPVSELKIDKTFVQNLARRADDRVIVQSVIELGHRMGYRVTAEGVEDERSLDLLRSYGCDEAQGYVISRPLPADRFAKGWRTRNDLASAMR